MTHKRNVSGMHAAPRCEAQTKDYRRCANPAVSGKRRCAVHGGKASAGKNHRQEHGDYTKAELRFDQLLGPIIKRVDKLARRVARTGQGSAIEDDISTISRMLHHITKRKQAELAAAYVPSEAERQAERDAAARLDLARRYSLPGQGSRERVRDRARGALLGLAAGEAVGITLAGWKRDSYRMIEEMVGGGELGLKPGQWAGDTAMAITLGDSLLYRHQLDEYDFIERLVEWRDEGINSCTTKCLGLGETTARALERYGDIGDPIAGETHADCLSNGSLARIAPVAVRYCNREIARGEAAERQSLVTHGGPYAVTACRAFADILAEAIEGQSRELVLRCRHVYVHNSNRVLEVGNWSGRGRDEMSGANNALDSLEAALWAVGTTETFEEAVLAAANLGEDAGSTAAIAGQLAGALYGACNIPDRWLEQLAWRDKIADMADALFAQSGKRS